MNPAAFIRVRARSCFALLFGINCPVIDRHSRSGLARIAVIFWGGGSQNEHKAGIRSPDMFHNSPQPVGSANRNYIGIDFPIVKLTIREGVS